MTDTPEPTDRDRDRDRDTEPAPPPIKAWEFDREQGWRELEALDHMAGKVLHPDEPEPCPPTLRDGGAK
jgi:hypothetical protein